MLEPLKRAKFEHQLKGLMKKGDYESFKNEIFDKKNHLSLAYFHNNLGLYFFQKGDYALSRYHYLRSSFYAPYTKTSKTIMKQTERKLFKNSPEIKFNLFENILYKIEVIDLALIGVIFSFFILFFCRKRIYDTVNGLRNLLLTIFCNFIFFGGLKLFLGNYISAVMIKDSYIYKGPSRIFEQKVFIPSGQKIIIQKTKGNFRKIVAPQKYSGWINDKNLGFMPNKR